VEETRKPRCIIAFTSEDEKYAAVRHAAISLARQNSARLILYDIAAGSIFTDPLPNEWGSEGERELFGNPLTPDDLERAGRHEVARQVNRARQMGVEAYAWLPADRGAPALAEYAAEQEADLIMVPSELEDPGMLDRLSGRSVEGMESETEIPVATVDSSGRIEYQTVAG
jgi:nucleotide-binding universal stress UspA family protein